MHILIDVTNTENCPEDKNLLMSQLRYCATILNVNIVQEVIHEFSPYGLSGILVIAESHIAVHTYPEYNTIHLDLFTCSKVPKKDLTKAINYLNKEWGGTFSIRKVERKFSVPVNK